MPFTQNAAAPLEEGASSAPPCAPGGGRQLFRLVVCDEAGAALRLATDADLLQLLGGGHPAPVAAPPRPAHHHQQPREPSFQELLAETHKRGGPVCDHCGATESPQWRRGPPNKAILCNACGTRYRRTNQLGSTVPSNQRKRQAAQQHCGGQALKHGGQPAAKQHRVSVA